MPFTFAHPAAVLPLRHMRLMRTVPLIIGAMTPDVPYFLPWRITKHLPETTHTFLGSYTLDLWIGVSLLLFLWLLRVPLAAPLGPGARSKCLGALERFGSQPLNWALAPLSLLIGAWTHLLWDSFTHPDGLMVQRISALSAPVSLFSYTGELCHVLQYASSVFGLAVLAIWFALLPAPARERSNDERGAGGPLLLAALFAGAAVAGGLETVAHFLPHLTASYRLFYLLLTRTAAWFAVLYTATGILIVRWRRRTPAPSVLD
ncbi:MAG TPA: DUF4184 family protein [Steroidobacteraceae bacterium]|jgi:hypothetical protein